MYEMLEALQAYIIANINNALPSGLAKIDSKNIIITEPDTDKYQNKVMIFITFDGASYTELTMNSDAAVLSPEIYIMNRGLSKEDLFTNIMHYSDAFIDIIRDDGSLSGHVDKCSIQNVEYFNGVFADEGIKCMKITLNLEYEDYYKET